jgi:hypothetical protein
MRISLKNEIGNILESAAYLKEDRNEWGENISIYQAEANGFRCSFAVSDRYPLSEAVEDLKKKAERMFRKPSAKIDRGQNFQKALLYINEHREVIPLVKFLREKCGSARHDVADTMKSWVEQYAKKHGAIPSYVKPYYYPRFSKLYYLFKDNKSPESLYEAADMIPKARIS